MAKKNDQQTLTERVSGAVRRGVHSLCRFAVLTAVMVGAFLLLIDLGRYFSNSSDFTVKQISFEGNHRLTEEEIYARAAIPPDTNIWMVNLRQIQERFEKHPAVKQVAVQRVPPNRIHIQFLERNPVAFIQAPFDNRFYGIGPKGVMVTEVDNYGMDQYLSGVDEYQEFLSHPVLSANCEINFQLGAQNDDPRLIEVLGFLNRVKHDFPKLFSEWAEVELNNDDNVYLHPKQRIGVIVLRELGSSDLPKKLNAFWSVIQQEEIRAIYVDARFPAQGFAVRWDTADGEQWKRLYRDNDEEKLISAGVME